MEMCTFVDLYTFLQTYKETDILGWLNIKWDGKDKQESLLRLFAGLGLLRKLNNYKICKGNFNMKTITPHTSLKDVFYDDKNNPLKLKDKGSASDLTGVSKNNQTHILVCTSKNKNKINVGTLDIDKILTNFRKYERNYTMTLCIVVRNQTSYIEMKQHIENTNDDLKQVLNKDGTIVLDWNDLNEAYHSFKLFFSDVSIENIMSCDKQTSVFKMHQHFSITKTINKKNNKKGKILWGHIPRSGKSYIMVGCIIIDSKNKTSCNYLVITTAPNETLKQYLEAFNSLQLKDFNIVCLNGQNNKPILKDKNIIICSKQFLQKKLDDTEKTKNISWLKPLMFEMRFLDESHNGGTTELAKTTLKHYGNTAFTVHITASYSKPVNDYQIPRDDWILWDMEDVKLCKDILTNEEQTVNKLVDKHGQEIKQSLAMFSKESIYEQYCEYPDLHVLTDEINDETLRQIHECTKDTQYGWSTDACFLLKQTVASGNIQKVACFQNETENLNLWYKIFGKRNAFGVPDKDYPNDIVFMKRIEKICKNPATSSRFIGDIEDPMVILAFLPQNDIDLVSQATSNILMKHKIIPEFDIVSINSKITSNPKKTIEDACIKAKLSNKKGVLVLSGKQCSLGVSIDNCDIVILLNNNTSFDMIYQMMFRGMTHGQGKNCGFVIDMNIHRVIETSIMEYASIIKPDSHPKDGTKYLLQERIINLNVDHWMPCFGKHTSNIMKLSDNIYNIYSTNTEKALTHLIDRLRFKQILLTKDDQKVFSAMFHNSLKTKSQKQLLVGVEHKENNINKGIEKDKVETDNQATNDETDEEECDTNINYMEVFTHVIPLVCLLTIHDAESTLIEMFDLIQNNKYVYDILIDQTRSWWGENINNKFLNNFIEIYMKYIKDDKEVSQIIRTIKEMFQKNVNNSKELSVLIDKYFVPQEMEKKNNAEVSTPHKLRQEMLDKMPEDFWKQPRKVLEPCSGKGGFCVDIVGRFMEGLQDIIQDEKERYKKIVEECLYWCDINPTNIFVCKLLLDPYNEYFLNYCEGDTLKMDITKEWGLDGFDAVIGNPPYSTDPSKQNTKPIYNLFVEKFIDTTKYLLFVIPSRWFVGGKGLDKFREMMMKRKDIKLMNHEDSSKTWFGNIVEIKGGVSYFLKDETHDGLCKFNDVSYQLDKYDCIIKPKAHNVIDKLINITSLATLYISSGFFKYRTNDKRLKDVGSVKCYVSLLKSKNRCKFIDEYGFTETNTFWKVLTSRATLGAYSGFGNFICAMPQEIFTDSYIAFKVNNEDEAKSLESYLKCKLPNYMLSIRKISQDINENVCKWIPLVPLDREWDDKQVFEYFNIQESELL
jgi:hypothetical protein